MGAAICGFIFGAVFGIFTFALIISNQSGENITNDYMLGYRDGYNDAQLTKGKDKSNKH